ARRNGMTIVAITLAVALLLAVGALWLVVLTQARSAPSITVDALVPLPRTDRIDAPIPIMPRPRLPRMTRTRPEPLVGRPRRPSKPRRLPTNAFSDEICPAPVHADVTAAAHQYAPTKPTTAPMAPPTAAPTGAPTPKKKTPMAAPAAAPTAAPARVP